MHNNVLINRNYSFPTLGQKYRKIRIVPDRVLTYANSGSFFLPAQPTWFHRLPEILAALQAMQASHLDRLAMEVLFGVRERRARQIMGGLEGMRVGNASAVCRLALIRTLEEIAASGAFEWEISRRARVVEELDRTRRHAAARAVRIPAAADLYTRRLKELSSDIVLVPGELRIRFHGAEDLAAKLLELSQAMANDWPAFAAAVEGG